MSIKDTLAKLDDGVLTELLDNAQFALNDMATAKKVAKEFGTPLARVQALATSRCSYPWSQIECRILQRCPRYIRFRPNWLTGRKKLN